MSEHNLGSFYTDYYRTQSSHDSPQASRTNMARRVRAEVRQLGRPLIVLNLGAGRGDVEGALLRTNESEAHRNVLSSHFVSIDLADIAPSRLIKPHSRDHVRADSRELPFRDESFDIVMSNLSIDMLRRNQNSDYEAAMLEARRVLKLGGVALFSFHHYDLFNLISLNQRHNDPVIKGFYNGKEEDNPYYASEAEIVDDLTRFGFSDGVAGQVEDQADHWWEATATKSPNSGIIST